MKPFFLVFTALCAIQAPVFAQHEPFQNDNTTSGAAQFIRSASANPSAGFTNIEQRYQLFRALSNNISASAAKGAAVKQRLIGMYWEDSTDWQEAPYRKYKVDFYYRNNQRGSAFDFHTMSYIYDYPLDRVPFFQYNVAPTDYQGVRADSLVRMEWCNNTRQLERRLSYGFGYNEANNKILSAAKYNVLCGGIPSDAIQTQETYDVNNRIMERSAFYLNPATNAWELFGRQHFRYNAAGKKLVDSVASYLNGAWNPENRIVYNYDASGNPISVSFERYNSGSFKQEALLEASFYTNGDVKTVKLSELTILSSGVVPKSIDSFGYTPGAPCFTYGLISNYSGGNLIPAGKQIRHLNSQLLPDTITEYAYAAGIPVLNKQAIYTYNSYGNPVMGRIYPAVADTINIDTVTVERYAYQEYTEVPPASAKTVRKGLFCTLYPVPAKNTLHIRWPQATADQHRQIRIINQNGQLVLEENSDLNTPVSTLQIGHLTPGIYYVLVGSLADGESFRQMFVKE